MSNPIIVYKGATTILPVRLGIDITGDTITSQIRAEPTQASALIATWTVTVEDAITGRITLTLDDDVTVAITATSGYTDLRRLAGGQPLAVFEKPLEVEFRELVTA